jgi:hypothetical protein
MQRKAIGLVLCVLLVGLLAGTAWAIHCAEGEQLLDAWDDADDMYREAVVDWDDHCSWCQWCPDEKSSCPDDGYALYMHLLISQWNVMDAEDAYWDHVNGCGYCMP